MLVSHQKFHYVSPLLGGISSNIICASPEITISSFVNLIFSALRPALDFTNPTTSYDLSKFFYQLTMSKAGAFTLQILKYYMFFCDAESICGTSAGRDHSLDGWGRSNFAAAVENCTGP
jgi:hypothetical protein